MKMLATVDFGKEPITQQWEFHPGESLMTVLAALPVALDKFGIGRFGRLVCFVAIFCMLASGCSRHQKIVLSSNDGSLKLIYDADDFTPQARTLEDIRVLMDNSLQVAQDNQVDTVTKMALVSAIANPTPNPKQLERIIYDYKVAQLKKAK